MREAILIIQTGDFDHTAEKTERGDGICGVAFGPFFVSIGEKMQNEMNIFIADCRQKGMSY